MENNTNMNEIKSPIEELVSRLLKHATAPNIDDVTTTFHDKEGDIEVSKEVVTLAHAKGKQETLTISDPAVIKAVRSFKAADAIAETSMYIKAKSLATMASHIETLKSQGFKTVGKFAYHVLGLSELTANQYARVGRAFLTDEGLPLACFPVGIQVTKMQEFLTYCVDENDVPNIGLIEALYAKNIVVDGMSQAKIREALKTHFKALPAGKEDNGKENGKDNGNSNGKDNGNSNGKDNSNNGSDSTVSFNDQLETMTGVEASAIGLSSLNNLEAIVKRFKDSMDEEHFKGAMVIVETLRNVMRAISEVK